MVNGADMKNDSYAYYELTAQCAAPFITQSAIKRIQELAAGIDNWRRLLKAAEACRAIPLLCDRLYAAEVSQIPPDARESMRRAAILNAYRNSHLTGVLASVIDILKTKGIPAITHKGPLLAHEAYDNPSLRLFDDLDIIVRRTDLPAAAEAIKKTGYREVGAARHSALLPAAPYLLQAVDRTHFIDLTDRLTNNTLAFEIRQEELWNDRRFIEIEGNTFPVMSPEHQLLYLCVHGAKHLWHRPTWIADIAGLMLQQKQPVNPAGLTRIAQSTGAMRMLAVALQLAHLEYDVPIPPETESLIAGDRLTDEISESIHKIIRKTPGVLSCGKFELLRYYLQMQTGTADRTKTLLRLFFVPTEKDYKAIKLPQSLNILYYAVHPLRPLAKIITA